MWDFFFCACVHSIRLWGPLLSRYRCLCFPTPWKFFCIVRTDASPPPFSLSLVSYNQHHSRLHFTKELFRQAIQHITACITQFKPRLMGAGRAPSSYTQINRACRRLSYTAATIKSLPTVLASDTASALIFPPGSQNLIISWDRISRKASGAEKTIETESGSDREKTEKNKGTQLFSVFVYVK